MSVSASAGPHAPAGYEASAGTEFAMPTPGYQTTTNGPCYVDMVDRYLQRTGDRLPHRAVNQRAVPSRRNGPFYWGGGGKYEIGVHPLPDNKLYCITLDEGLNIKTSKEVDTQTVRQNNDSHCFGFEDARLFRWQNRWWALANSPRAKFLDGNNMTLLELNDDFEIKKAVLLASPFDREREKNWTPVIHDDRLFIIYEWQPLAVYEIDPEQYRLQLRRICIQDVKDSVWSGCAPCATSCAATRNIFSSVSDGLLDRRPTRFGLIR